MIWSIIHHSTALPRFISGGDFALVFRLLCFAFQSSSHRHRHAVTKIVRFCPLHAASDAALASDSIDAEFRGGVISIGNFDGVHIGHRALLSEVHRQAATIDAPSLAVIFDPHPATILRPGFVPDRLSSVDRRCELMNQSNIDYLLVIQTSQELLQLSAEAFFDKIIVNQLQAVSIVEGPNFFFGRDRQGDVDLLDQMCQANQIKFTIAAPTNDGGQMISSTRIRQLLASGDIRQANDFLGTEYRIEGQVTTGEKRGRTIGFPTANLDDIDVVTPRRGVYGGWATVDGQTFAAAIHIGPNPTFDEAADKIEVHLLNFSDDLYGRRLLVDFVSFVRDIARFHSAEHLTKQLRQDVATIRDQLKLNRNVSNGDNANNSDNLGM